MKHYLLVGKEVVMIESREVWLRKSMARSPMSDVVGDTTVGETRISTTFLMGIDHGHTGGKPILFETMTFGGILDEIQCRYATYEEAEKGHAEIVAAVREAQYQLDKMFLIALGCDLENAYERNRPSQAGVAGTART